MDTTSGVDMSVPDHLGDILRRKDYQKFDVSAETFRKFQTGRTKFSRWSKYLDEEDDVTSAGIKSYAQKNPKHTVVLQCKETGAIRQLRRTSSNGL